MKDRVIDMAVTALSTAEGIIFNVVAFCITRRMRKGDSA